MVNNFLQVQAVCTADGGYVVESNEPITHIMTDSDEECQPVLGGFQCGDTFVKLDKTSAGSNSLAIQGSPKFHTLTIFKGSPFTSNETIVYNKLVKAAGNDIYDIIDIARANRDIKLFNRTIKLNANNRHKNQDEKDRTSGFIATAMAESGFFDEAVVVAKEIRGEYERADTLVDIAKTNGDVKLLETAVGIETANNEASYEKVRILVKTAEITGDNKLIEQAIEVAKELNGGGRVFALVFILSVCKDGALIEKILEVARGITDELYLALVLKDIYKAGDPKIMNLVDEAAVGINASKWAVQKIEAITERAVERNDIVGLEKAIEITGHIEEEHLKQNGYVEIAKAMAQLKAYDRALEIRSGLAEGRNWNWKTDAGVGIVSAMIKDKMYERALEIITTVEREDEFAYLRTDEATSDIAIAFAKAKGFDKALEVAKGVGGMCMFRYLATQVAIAEEMAKAGQYDRSLELAHDIENAYSMQDRAHTWIAVAMAKRGDFDRAFKVTRLIKDKGWRHIAMARIPKAMVEAGLFAKGIRTLEKIKDTDLQFATLMEIFMSLRSARVKLPSCNANNSISSLRVFWPLQASRLPVVERVAREIQIQ